MPPLSAIQIRDPFILPVATENKYFLYGTTDANCWSGPGTGFDVYTSRDLQRWDGPTPAFRPEVNFWGKENFWAPEVYRYGTRYFMFASFTAPGRCRGTQVLVSNDPRGPFQPHSNGPLTPSDWECLDGTLFVDLDDTPWMVFCHEWVQVHDGEIWAVPLAKDLRKTAGDPTLLFRASSAPWVARKEDQQDFVTDGPFLYQAWSGEVLMLWSSMGAGGYTLGVARSASGMVTGPWTHDPEPLYTGDGGHGMLFTTFDDQLMLAVHAPNQTPHERAQLLPVKEVEGKLVCVTPAGTGKK